jgi:hypothetical protein
MLRFRGSISLTVSRIILDYNKTGHDKINDKQLYLEYIHREGCNETQVN